MPVITVSGALGSGGPDLVSRLSEALKLEIVDRTLLIKASQRLGVPVEHVADMDERPLSIGERLSQILHAFFERSATVGTADPMSGASGLEVMLARNYEDEAENLEPDLTDKGYVEALTAIMTEVASHKNVLIIGRGAQVILRDYPGILHVNVVAPKDVRIQDLMKLEGISHEEATRRVEANDRGREAYHGRMFKVRPNDPTQYHLTINTALMSIDAAVRAIAGAATNGVAPSASATPQ